LRVAVRRRNPRNAEDVSVTVMMFAMIIFLYCILCITLSRLNEAERLFTLAAKIVRHAWFISKKRRDRFETKAPTIALDD